jgi:hypothetical protein
MKNRLIELQVSILEDIVMLASKTCDLINEIEEERIEVERLPTFNVAALNSMKAFAGLDKEAKSPDVKLTAPTKMKVEDNDVATKVGAQRVRPKKAQA